MLPAAAQDSVMADPHKPFGQDMQTEALDKLLAAQGHFLFRPTFAVIFVGKTNFFICDFLNPVIADGHLTP